MAYNDLKARLTEWDSQENSQRSQVDQYQDKILRASRVEHISLSLTTHKVGPSPPAEKSKYLLEEDQLSDDGADFGLIESYTASIKPVPVKPAP